VIEIILYFIFFASLSYVALRIKSKIKNKKKDKELIKENVKEEIVNKNTSVNMLNDKNLSVFTTKDGNYIIIDEILVNEINNLKFFGNNIEENIKKLILQRIDEVSMLFNKENFLPIIILPLSVNMLRFLSKNFLKEIENKNTVIVPFKYFPLVINYLSNISDFKNINFKKLVENLNKNILFINLISQYLPSEEKKEEIVKTEVKKKPLYPLLYR